MLINLIGNQNSCSVNFFKLHLFTNCPNCECEMFLFRFMIVAITILTSFAPLHSEDSPRLLIKMPTRNRYKKFFKTLDAYYSKLSGKVSYHFVISCDSDDKVMNSRKAIKRLKKYPNLSVYFGNNENKIAACNADIEKHGSFDIILLASDDMIPVVDGYDYIISEAFKTHFPELDGVIQYDDGYVKDALVTLPIMGKKYYDHFGYVYYPGYITSHCDNELTIVAKQLGKLHYIDQVIIKHFHPNWGNAQMDELYYENLYGWQEDQKLFAERKQRNFDITPLN